MGIAFVTLEDPSLIDTVIEKLNGKPLEGRYVEVMRAKPPMERPYIRYPPSYPHYPPPHYPRVPRGPAHAPAPAAPAPKPAPKPTPKPAPKSAPAAPRKPAPATPAAPAADATRKPRLSFVRKGDHAQRQESEPNPDRVASQLTAVVQNLPYIAGDQDMYDIFDGFNILEANVRRKPDGQSRGVAFVTFATHEEQQRAINDVDNTMVEGRPIRVVPAYLLPNQLEHEKEVVQAAAQNTD